MISGSPATTARRVACPTCSASIFEYCISDTGTALFHSHPDRVVASRAAAPLTPQRMQVLRDLHADPTRDIPPSMRQALLRLKYIERSADTVATPGHQRGKRPKRRHPLTDAGRKAIGVEHHGESVQEGARP